ncbi:M56 family metallopeptidase [Listeria seeligeri]|uniref:M56 family metallopeptidase n=1 Tax=Listeria seeligeri TaxID=1640 RepID=UPI0009532314|nr:M56 family metallopeptidase [Listeria seeligeri]MBF2373934.1 M56 family metallopeptidase [Listeria seeligeri]OLQ24622.1 peptidase M56 [Listeria seeligeri]
MNELLKIILSMALTSLVLIPFVWGFGRIFNRFLSKRKIYYLWLVVYLFLTVPFSLFFLLPYKNSDFMWLNRTGFEGVTSIVMDGNGVSVERDAKITFWMTLLDYLWLIWLIIFLLIFIYRIASYRNFKKYVFSGAQNVENINQLNMLAEISESLKIKKPVELLVNPLISSPIFIGLKKQVIILPDKSYSEKELKFIFRHELVHCKRKDMFYVWAAQFYTCVYWFNPFVYLMNKRIQKDRELACDEAVLNAISANEFLGYGDTLLSSLTKAGNYKEAHVSVSLHENAKALKERLEFIANYKKTTKPLKFILPIFLIVFCSIGITLSAYQAEILVKEKQKGIVIKKEW